MFVSAVQQRQTLRSKALSAVLLQSASEWL